ncbi:MAG: 50S ribosomal protein L10 [Acidimicrobiia bacterium]|nr:50S ribosomal protein L10 [Acidimicrobiia bacterium]
MPRPEKVQAVEEIKERLENSEATFLAEYRGLSVSEQQQLRRGLRAADAEYKVVKMSLARRAATELGLDELIESMHGPTALAFANSDAVPVAKVLKDFAKEHDRLVLKVGLMSGKLLPPEQVSKLAEIEPRDVLLAKIAGAAKAPLSKMAGMLGSFVRDSASLFFQLLEIKESSEPAPAAEVEAPASTDRVEAAADPAEVSAPADKAEVAETTTDEAAEGEEPTAEVDQTHSAEAELAEAGEGPEEEAESDDESDSDSQNDDKADQAEEE